MSESATTVQPKTIVIERRWAIIGGSIVAALVLILSVALAFSLGDNSGGPDGPHGLEFSQQGFAPGAPEGGTQQMPQNLPQGAPPMQNLPQGAPPMPQGVAPDGAVPTPQRGSNQ